MPTHSSHRQPISRAAVALVLLVVGAGLSGCAEMSDGMTSAFADPAKYDLYECKQSSRDVRAWRRDRRNCRA